MISMLTAFFVSFISSLLIIRFKHLHVQFSGDHNLSGPQKFHAESVPRIGGVSIAIGILAAILIGLHSGITDIFSPKNIAKYVYKIP